VGSSVGCSVGSAVGEDVGSSVGDAVGACDSKAERFRITNRLVFLSSGRYVDHCGSGEMRMMAFA
jgi:hypothetical protein